MAPPYLPSEITAAVLLAQMEGFELDPGTTPARLGDVRPRAGRVGRRLPGAADGGTARLRAARAPVLAMLPSAADQSAFINQMRRAGIATAFHYQALDSSPAGRRLARAPRPCPVSARAAAQPRLPLHADLTETDLARIVTAVRTYRPQS